MDIIANIPPLAWAVVILPAAILLFWLTAGMKSAIDAEEEHDADPPS